MVEIYSNMIDPKGLMEAIKFRYREQLEYGDLEFHEEGESKGLAERILGYVKRKARETIPEIEIQTPEQIMLDVYSGEIPKVDVVIAAYAKRDNEHFIPTLDVGYFERDSEEIFGNFLKKLDILNLKIDKSERRESKRRELEELLK